MDEQLKSISKKYNFYLGLKFDLEAFGDEDDHLQNIIQSLKSKLIALDEKRQVLKQNIHPHGTLFESKNRLAKPRRTNKSYGKKVCVLQSQGFKSRGGRSWVELAPGSNRG